MKKRVATLILNRNLPAITEALVEEITEHNSNATDVFVIESGSDDDLLSKYTTWHADWPDARSRGLRYFQGMNYGLLNLYKTERLKDYDAFFLIANDVILEKKDGINDLLNVLDTNPKVGMVSPCSTVWGEKFLLENNNLKYFWNINPGAYLVRRELIEVLCEQDEPTEQNFLFDGTNFRGYSVDTEFIAKIYANDWAAAITPTVMFSENESYLLEHSDLIKTEPFDDNLKLYIQEGNIWMKKKFGFNNHWTMQVYVKSFYEQFFIMNPDLIDRKL